MAGEPPLPSLLEERFAHAVLADVLRTQAQEAGDRPFVSCHDRCFTYRAIDESADRVASGLAGLGVAPGEHVMLMLPNDIAFIQAMFGIARLGAVEVPVNTAYKTHHLSYVIGDAVPVVIIVHEQWLDRIVPALATGSSPRALIVAGGDAPLPDVGIQILRFSDLLQSPIVIEPPSPSRLSLAAINYTSGTTGASKGVEITHAHQILYALQWCHAVDYSEKDVLFGPLPLFHALARTLGVLPTLLRGAHMVIEERFSLSAFWARAKAVNATIVHGIFGMVPMLLNQPPAQGDREHRIRAFYIGPSSLAGQFRERFGIHLVEVFGATETGIVTCFPFGEWRSGSCGLPNAEVFDVMVADDDDVPVAVGRVGEILVRPRIPHVLMRGYHGKPDATLAATRNLWFHTGDYGRADEDGYLYFVDRKSDALRRRGENISSFELERAVNDHPAVLESAAVGVPSDVMEDEVKICVVSRPGQVLDPEDLIRFLDIRLPYFMVPRYVDVLETLPKTPNQKVRKVELRSAGITASTWDREAYGVHVTR